MVRSSRRERSTLARDRATVTWPSSLTVCLGFSGGLVPTWRTTLLASNRSAYTARGRPSWLADGRTLTTWPGGTLGRSTPARMSSGCLASMPSPSSLGLRVSTTM